MWFQMQQCLNKIIWKKIIQTLKAYGRVTNISGLDFFVYFLLGNAYEKCNNAHFLDLAEK